MSENSSLESVKSLFNEIRETLKEKVRKDELNPEDFEKIIKDYKELGFELEKIVEYKMKYAKEEERKKLENLHRRLSTQNVGELCDRLRNYGFRLRDKEVYKRFYDKDKNAVKGIVFRLLELARLGKRDEVLHIILREFVTSQQEVDQNLLNAFNPKYSDESFRTLIYSFLSGLLGSSLSNSKEEGENVE